MSATGYPHFGFSDAEDEIKIGPLFYSLPILETLKLDSKDFGTFIVVGAKGMGKTAIRKSIEEARPSDDHVLVIRQTEQGTAITNPHVTAAGAKSVFLNHILISIGNEVLANREDFSEGAVQPINQLFENTLASKLKKLVSGSTLEAGVPGLKLELPFEKANLNKIQQVGLDDYVNAYFQAVSERRFYILLDDPDYVFPGIDSSPQLLEGLVNAVAEINRHFRSNLHVLLFLADSPYSIYRSRARTADKAVDYFSFLAWTRDDLTKMLANRIRYIRSISTQKSDLALWREEFAGDRNNVLQIQEFMVRRCVNGPRDLIHMANLAYRNAGSDKIQLSHLEAIERPFSHDKLAQLNQLWDHEYQQIADHIFTAFAGTQQFIFTKKEFSMYWESHALPEFGRNTPQFFNTSTLNVIRVLYRVGFLGYAEENAHGMATYVTSLPHPGTRLTEANYYHVHPAYHRALMA